MVHIYLRHFVCFSCEFRWRHWKRRRKHHRMRARRWRFARDRARYLEAPWVRQDSPTNLTDPDLP